jgi:methionyl-tRNA synthetase
MAQSFYITTPIYYVNDVPHIGHAYTTIAADVITRWHRQNGRDAYFLTGTDEHGQKVHEAALARGMSPQQHVDELCQPFAKLWERLQITHDDFIRTTEKRHTDVVQAALQTLFDSGDIYAADYEGWYSKSEERFWTEKDLVDGKCPISGNTVEWLKEKNYFFKMAKYADQLRAWIEDNPDFLQPANRKNEVLGYLKKEVSDLCISRPKTRLPWGIPLPFDSAFVTYVWFDALLNYCTAIGYHPDGSTEQFETLWPASYHLVGKDILTTHSVYFSTMLFALGQRPAECLYAHGWWTIEGRKMSKSVGNVVDPHLLIDCYGVDAVRYFLMREIPFGGDGDFSHSAFMTRYNADLANDLGNLAHRSLSMTTKWLGGVVPELDAATERDRVLSQLTEQTLADFTKQIEQLHFSVALQTLWGLVRAGNKYIDDEAPWALNREGQAQRLAGVMRRCLEVCRVAATLLAPFCPDKAAELGAKLGLSELDLGTAGGLDGLTAGCPVPPGEPLFPRMTELPPRIQQTLDSLTQPAAPAPVKPKPKPKKETPVSEETTEETPRISIDDFFKVELKAGKILAAEPHPNADRLLVLKVDIGEPEPRNIVAGIAAKYSPDELVGKQVVIVCNLKPAKLRGVVSEGMLLACGGKAIDGLVTVDPECAPGSVVR